jgi:hypothetical protein
VVVLQRRPGVTSQTHRSQACWRAPLLGVATLFLLSLIGILPTAGFGKMLISCRRSRAAAGYARGHPHDQRHGGRVLLPARGVTMYMREAPENAKPVTIGG